MSDEYADRVAAIQSILEEKAVLEERLTWCIQNHIPTGVLYPLRIKSITVSLLTRDTAEGNFRYYPEVTIELDAIS